MPYVTTPLISHVLPGPDALSNAREIIKDKLYFTSVSQTPSQHPSIHYFSIDETLVYIAFYSDFGPNNLSHVIRFCDLVNEKFTNPATCNKKMCLYTSMDSDKRANAAFLMCCYMLIVHRQSPDEAFRPFQNINPPFLPYRDAGYGAATYHITVLDCLRGLYKALNVGLLDLDALDLDAYEFYEKVENGDMNWICDKFCALASPHDDPVLPGAYAPGTPGAASKSNVGPAATYSGMLANGFPAAVAGIVARSAYMPAPSDFQLQQQQAMAMASQVLGANGKKRLYSAFKIDDLVRYLKENKVTSLVRLNNKIYERKIFVDAGVEHVELYFPDGTTPPDHILKRFLELCEQRQGAIAIHCKAGLGRTGTLIAAYLMKHYRFTTSEVIGYLRVMRPGSVVGPQQNFLQSLQPKLFKMTPSTRLPQSVSLLRTPNFYTMRRFPIPPVLANVMVPLPPKQSQDYMESQLYGSNTVSTPMSLDSDDESDMGDEMYLDARDGEASQQQQQNMARVGHSEVMAVPLQPRKPGVNGGQADAAGDVSAPTTRTSSLDYKQTQSTTRSGFASSVSSIVSSMYATNSTTSSASSLYGAQTTTTNKYTMSASTTTTTNAGARYNLRSGEQQPQVNMVTQQPQASVNTATPQTKYGGIDQRVSTQFVVQGRSTSGSSAKN
ncbi:hypothetical protein SmJEL517_g01462 [Synchytrium microbalum]|uniref:protein-tyrosine-phosphatase n=1 Tax=Synchytrium microbalum TaxID=1806994 RepID=A0A507CEA1_9FUNG|nr:uncharacterized protein SmJEL517_g01462 [Synchytrium microbalum]TPX36254.1 hypothetical protein SmJEL517_g01462 [Synchytrium microbalum]